MHIARFFLDFLTLVMKDWEIVLKLKFLFGVLNIHAYLKYVLDILRKYMN